MAKLNEDWKVEPCGPLQQLDDGFLTVTAIIRMPIDNCPRRMTVVALSDRRAAIWSAMPLREPDMRRIEAGVPKAIQLLLSASVRLCWIAVRCA